MFIARFMPFTFITKEGKKRLADYEKYKKFERISEFENKRNEKNKTLLDNKKLLDEKFNASLEEARKKTDEMQPKIEEKVNKELENEAKARKELASKPNEKKPEDNNVQDQDVKLASDKPVQSEANNPNANLKQNNNPLGPSIDKMENYNAFQYKNDIGSIVVEMRAASNMMKRSGRFSAEYRKASKQFNELNQYIKDKPELLNGLKDINNPNSFVIDGVKILYDANKNNKEMRELTARGIAQNVNLKAQFLEEKNPHQIKDQMRFDINFQAAKLESQKSLSTANITPVASSTLSVPPRRVSCESRRKNNQFTI